MPDDSSRNAVVLGLSKIGGLYAASVRSPIVSFSPWLSRYSRSMGSGAKVLMMPVPRNVVIRRSSGFSSSSRARLPMWSKSVWLSQIHRSSAGSITERSDVMKSSASTKACVSTSIGSAPLKTKAFTGISPNPGIGISDAITSMSGVAA